MATYLKDPAINSGKLSTESYYIYGSSMLGAFNYVTDMESAYTPPETVTFERGGKNFYLGNQLNNNLVVLSDKKIGFDDNGDGITDRYEADILSATDYSAYGENLKGRELNSSLIKFGFNGKWNDVETGYQDYGMRMYSNRRRGFVSVDPITKKYPELTPYQFASNRPIDGVDLDGLEYTPQGRYGPNQIAVDQTAVKMYSNNPAIIQQTSARLEFERKQKYFSTQSNNYVSPLQQEINNTRTSDAGYNPNGTKKAWLKFAENPTVNKFADNIVSPMVKAYTVVDGVGELYKFGMGIIRYNFAIDFYLKQGYSKVKALEHIEGIDFTKKVFETTLKEGTVIQQWVGENGVGSYFTTLENGSVENLGLNPSEYVKRKLKQFTLKEDTKVLQSTAAPLNGGEGGGTQYFSPELKTNTKPTTTTTTQ